MTGLLLSHFSLDESLVAKGATLENVGVVDLMDRLGGIARSVLLLLPTLSFR